MTPTLIIDCSITMGWCFADEATLETARVQDRMIVEAALVPGHWCLEVVNVLVMAERRKRIAAADATTFLQLLSTFDIQCDQETSAARSTTCRRFAAITAYQVTTPPTLSLLCGDVCRWLRWTMNFTWRQLVSESKSWANDCMATLESATLTSCYHKVPSQPSPMALNVESHGLTRTPPIGRRIGLRLRERAGA